jgi:hypothetical protein
MGSGEWIYQRTGALALLFEGGSGDRYSGDSIHRQVLETYLLLLETVCEVGVEEGSG